MRTLLFRGFVGAAALALFAYAFSACTAITLAEWGSYTDGSDGGGTNPQAQSACNPPYLASLAPCGKCMNDNCANQISAVCKIDSGSSYATPWADEYLLPCAKDPSVGSYECNTFLKAPDAAISPGNDPAALESNVEQCLKGACYDDCRRCTITYPGCLNKDVTLGTETDRLCGSCITKMCAVELANACGDLAVDPIAACAGSDKTCHTTDCSKLLTGDAGAVSANTKIVYKCIIDNCGPTGSGQCQ